MHDTRLQRTKFMLVGQTWVIDDKFARELGAAHDRDVVLQEDIGGHQQLLQA